MNEPTLVKAQLVNGPASDCTVPLLAISIRLPVGKMVVFKAAVGVELSVKEKSLRSWPALSGLLRRSFNVTVMLLVKVTTVAEALTGPPAEVDPMGVTQRVVFADDKPTVSTSKLANFIMLILFPS
jgi:hypothetical protein